MVNFTGLTKKRIVNLGGPGRSLGGSNGSSSRLSSTSYLELSKSQRKEREEQRARERAVSVIHSYVVRYLEMLSIRKQLYQQWNDGVDNMEDGDSDAGGDKDVWVYQLRFLCRWKRLDLKEIEVLLDRVIARISKDDDLESHLSRYAIECLVATVEKLLVKSSQHKGERAEYCMGQAVKILVLIDGSTTNVNRHMQTTAVNVVDSISKNFLKIQNTQVARDLVELVVSINVREKTANFFKFLAIPGIVNGAGEPLFLKYGVEIRDILKSYPSDITSLSSTGRVNLLANALALSCLYKDGSSFGSEDFVIFSNILSYISFSIGDVKSSSKVYVPATVITQLEPFYSSIFIKKAFSLLESGSDRDVTNTLQVLTTLLFFIPSLKNKLCMLITVTSGSYKLFYSWIKREPTFQQIATVISPQNDYTRGNVNVNFWKLVYTFQELYSYWLIVSNDLETFSPNVLAIEDISEFMTFLKNLCLKLIIEGESNIKFKDFDKLKDISISLLNQLYLRNLRLEFVDTDFWKLTEVNFNLDQMLKIIIDEEAKRAENKTEEGEEEEDEEDEEIEDEEMEEADEGIGGDGDWWDIENDVNIDNENKMGKEFDILPPSLTTAKLEILNKLPFFVPFKDRVKIFQTLIALDRQRFQEQQGLSYYNPFQNRLKADIRREFLLEDAFNLFRLAGINFKHQLSVTFFNEYGGQEAGIDGGGITKEFLTSVVTEGFNPQNKLQLFQETSLNQIYPNEEISLSLQKKIEPVIQQEKLSYLRFLGTIIGKCFYENVLIDILFAPFFLTKWCNANRGISLKNSINDLNYLDSEFFQNLMKLTAMNDEELKELDLNFTINQIINGEQYKFNLIPDGETIMVDATNRLQYIHQVSNFKLNQSLHIQTKYFLEGLFELISSNWLCMFDAFELQMLILGGESDVNIQDWKDNVVYHGYFDDDITIVLFWEVVSEMTAKERFLLVKFATSVSRAPLLGFGSLHPKFAITHAGRSNERLPTASTCVNSLKLPDYQDKRIIKEKLLYAINNDARFDLS